MSRRDWTQNAFAAAAAAIAGGAGLPARADDDDKYAQIMSAAAEAERVRREQPKSGRRADLQKLRGAGVVQEEPLAATASAPFVSTLAGPRAGRGCVGCSRCGRRGLRGGRRVRVRRADRREEARVGVEDRGGEARCRRGGPAPEGEELEEKDAR